MRILVLGGTHFMGRHFAELALRRGHELTLLTRGETNPGLLTAPGPLAGATHIRADRRAPLEPLLAGETWDAVVDACGTRPETVAHAARVLSDQNPAYLFLSTFSVYRDFPPGLDESGPLLGLAPLEEDAPIVEFGALKAACEAVVREWFPERALIVRPGVVVGPHEPLPWLSWWIRRIARGGEFVAGSSPDQPLQLLDVRDLARFMLRLLEDRRAGTFNAASPAGALTTGELIDECLALSTGRAQPLWPGGSFLADRGVDQWTELPLCLFDEALHGLVGVDVSRAHRAGLRCRELPETLAATSAWLATGSAPASNWLGLSAARIGLSREREEALLHAWRRRSATPGEPGHPPRRTR
jgi:2'-hydroxyisoflavone reductase